MKEARAKVAAQHGAVARLVRRRCVRLVRGQELLQELSRRPNLFPAIARAAQEKVPCAEKFLENLNLAVEFPPRLVEAYKRYRVIVPFFKEPFWRCPPLETG